MTHRGGYSETDIIASFEIRGNILFYFASRTPLVLTHVGLNDAKAITQSKVTTFPTFRPFLWHST